MVAADSDGDGVVTEAEMRVYDDDGDGNPDYPNAVLRDSELYFSISHNVVKADALNCTDCHAEESVMDLEGLGYDTAEIESIKTALAIVDNTTDDTNVTDDDSDSSTPFIGVIPILVIVGLLAVIASAKRKNKDN